MMSSNSVLIDEWLPRAHQNPLFFGAKAKLEWQAGQTKHPNIWNQIFQLRPSGIRVKVNSYFPALVAIVQTSIVGSRRLSLHQESVQDCKVSQRISSQTLSKHKLTSNSAMLSMSVW